MLLNTTEEELQASPMQIAKDIAVIPVHLRPGVPTLEIAFRTMPSHTGQPPTLHRIRLHPENIHLFADMVAKMHKAATETPKTQH